MKPEIIGPKYCPSTHGAAGYAPGSYVREDGKVVCGICGMVLEPRKEAIGDWMTRKVTIDACATCKGTGKVWRMMMMSSIVDLTPEEAARGGSQYYQTRCPACQGKGH